MRRGKKKIKDIQIGKKEIKLSLLTIGVMVYIENAKAFNKNNNNNLLENKVNSASSQDTKWIYKNQLYFVLAMDTRTVK